MKSRDEIVLKKISEYCDQAEETLSLFNDSYEEFESNATFRNACCMCVLQIGELCKLISPELRKTEPEIPWKEWCGIRDVFAHQYSEINIPSAWDTLQNDLPKLKEKVGEMLDCLES